MTEIKNPNSILYNSTQGLNNNLDYHDYSKMNVYTEINNNIDEFKSIATNILNGTTNVNFIKENLDNFKNNNPYEYGKIIEKINKTIVNFNAENNNNNLINYDKNIHMNSMLRSSSNKIEDIVVEFEDNEKITITADQIAFFTKSEKFLSRLSIYRDKTYGVAVASATLTAASWAIAAFYWGAWWMFGGNIPFAVAATVQAGISTYLSVRSFDEYYDIRDRVKDLSDVVYSKEFKDMKLISECLLDEARNQLKNSAINFIKFIAKFTNVIQLYKKAIELIIKKISIEFEKYINTIVNNTSWKNVISFANKTPFKSLIMQINKKSTEFVTEIVTKKALMKGLSWASNAILVIDIIISISSFFIDVGIFNNSELSSW
ncbi:hypothetical protein [Malacoplasma iowae]|uniref:Uncharacterized protein n=1 Tax=Malacoplasma iowae 695 TaxID=1048830 RepID=A0A6P1LD15_MALIO|nr:hypothetical protein [Malacoplasma iowae]QHG89349.2 hypothetical protein EER00_00310 [Malacoplasma iowae 695]WPL35947.1 hypothetical protein QX180_00800 [Malacoplasma iowae]VEU61557.1 Uncharacterised protein [Mycoplasmopsis fermentans]VEU71458.1 Uncharacterised protein [Malacoplasma iowae]